MDEENIYHIIINGNHLFFNVTKNICKPCPDCGHPACGKENILWYEEEGENVALIFDGGNFEFYIDEYLTRNMTMHNYSFLPKFMRACNEVNGWIDSWELEGVELDMEDFTKSIRLMIGEKWGWNEMFKKEALNCFSEILHHIEAAKKKIRTCGL